MEVSDNEGQQFVTRDGKTYMMEDEELVLFGDFMLKLLGEIKSPQTVDEDQSAGAVNEEGYWLASCGVVTGERILYRNIVLSAGSFDTKCRFIHDLRKKFGGGTFNLAGNVGGNKLADYYSFLKEDVEGGEPRFFKASHMGYQGNGYWLLAKDHHIENGRVLQMEDYKFFIIDDSAYVYGTNMNNDLLGNNKRLERFFSRYIDLAEGFGLNSIMFKLATSFVLARNLRMKNENAFKESSIGLLHSIYRNVGKSQTLKILAKGEGFSDGHPLLCSGGDQTVSGTSIKLLMQALKNSSLTCMIDDAKMTDSLAEFLLHVQGGLPQGSMTSGSASPVGSVLLSTNVKESERLDDRVIRFDFVKDDDFGDDQEEVLEDLESFANANKGFIVAWISRYRELWERCIDGNKKIIKKILKRLMPKRDPRWYNGVSLTFCTYIVFHVSCGKEVDLPNALLKFSQTAQKQEEAVPFLERLQEEIQSKLDEENARESWPLKWITPNASVRHNGNLFPALGIAVSVIDNFASIRREEIQRECLKFCDTAKTQTLYFATVPEATIQDLQRRIPERSHGAKGIKIPLHVLHENIINQVKSACGVVGVERGDRYVTHRGDTNPLETDENMQELIATVTQSIRQIFEGDEISDDEDVQVEERLTNDMTPNTKKKYDLLTPRKRRIFIEGVEAGLRMSCKHSDGEKEEDNQQDGKDPDKSSDDIETDMFDIGMDICSPSVTTTPSKSARKSLFTDTVSGTVGVLRRLTQSTNESLQSPFDDDCCEICGQDEPPRKQRKSSSITWIGCDKCEKWHHCVCVGLRRKPPANKRWLCDKCKKNE